MAGRTFGDLAGSNQQPGLGGAAISEIRRLLRLLAASFNRRIDPDMESFWVTRLEKINGSALVEAMSELCDGEKFPTLKVIVDLQRAKARKKTAIALPEHVPTPEERKRTDHVAIQSMLWLHYAHPGEWPLSAFDGSIMSRLFDRSPVEALTKAKSIYTREELEKVMAKRFAQIDAEDAARV